MIEFSTLARPYAEAAYHRAQETETLQQWSDTLHLLAAIMRDPAMIAVCDNPKVKQEQLLRLWLDLVSGQVDQEGEHLIRLLIENKRLYLLEAISTLYERYRAEDEGYVDVSVESAFELSAADKKQLATKLKKTFKKKVRLQVTINEDLIGGIYVRAGDKVIDGTVRGQLQQMAKRLYS